MKVLILEENICKFEEGGQNIVVGIKGQKLSLGYDVCFFQICFFFGEVELFVMRQ